MSDSLLVSAFLQLLLLLFSLSVHEAAHAWTADRLGDPTARTLGRLSLNPLVHMDPIGTLLLPLIAILTGAPLIGWAKPVPVDLRFLRRGRRDFVLVAAAGPISNLLLACLAALAIRFFPQGGGDGGYLVLMLLAAALRLNLLLMLFNLIPVPPLDGGNVVGGLLRGELGHRYDALRPWGVLILYALMLSGALAAIIGPPYTLLERLLTL